MPPTPWGGERLLRNACEGLASYDSLERPSLGTETVFFSVLAEGTLGPLIPTRGKGRSGAGGASPMGSPLYNRATQRHRRPRQSTEIQSGHFFWFSADIGPVSARASPDKARTRIAKGSSRCTFARGPSRPGEQVCGVAHLTTFLEPPAGTGFSPRRAGFQHGGS